MRILWHSASPIAPTGYGIVTKEVTKRLRDAGHFVRIGTKHEDHGWYEWNGFEVFEGTDTYFINQMIEDEGFDYIITLWDIWLLHGKRQYPKEKWVAYIPIDTEWISKALAEVCVNTGTQIAMSKHGERELKSIGLNPHYVPHGVDTNVFKPKPEGRAAFRAELGLADDCFVIGSVGLNYGDDRKGFVPLMRAFKEFHTRHPKSVLYLHSLANERDARRNNINYHKIALNLGIDEALIWPPQLDYVLNRIDADWLADIYSGFDVFCLPTKGEGFGVPLIEAQACGVPIITTRTTTGPELCKTGWLIDVTDDDKRWLPNETWRYEPRPSAILKTLEGAYALWQTGDYEQIRGNAWAGVQEYSWGDVWEKSWLPVFKELEGRLK